MKRKNIKEFLNKEDVKENTKTIKRAKDFEY